MVSCELIDSLSYVAHRLLPPWSSNGFPSDAKALTIEKNSMNDFFQFPREIEFEHYSIVLVSATAILYPRITLSASSRTMKSSGKALSLW